MSPREAISEDLQVQPDTLQEHEYDDLQIMDEISLSHEGMTKEEADQAEGEHFSNEHQDSSPEPIFSSEEELRSSFSRPSLARMPFPNAFSSPTPTSADVPHAVSPSLDATPVPTRSTGGVTDEFATPYNRRRSFLLSLVHSTTRPRMTFPTPHPHTRAALIRPPSHPLSQAWTPSPESICLKPGSVLSSGSSHSPQDRLSFISTASSHDLTVHPRVNASFDPIVGAKGVGRFNAVKLNTYLHGLNRRLQEENEALVARLRMHGEEVEMGKVVEELESDGFKGVEEAVLEEVAAMRNELEKCEKERDTFEAETVTLAGQVAALQSDGDELRDALDTELQERARDKERWKERMTEVQSGVEKVIKALEKRLKEAEWGARGKIMAEDEARQLEERCNTIEQKLQLAICRAEKAEDALASSSALGADIKQAYEDVATHREDARLANQRVNELQSRLEDAMNTEERLKTSFEEQLADMDVEFHQSLEAQQSAEAHALELEAEVKAADEQINRLEKELTMARKKTTDLEAEKQGIHAKLEKEQCETARAAEFAQQMEDALEESERKMIADEKELLSLRAKTIHLERELEARQGPSKTSTSFGPDLSHSQGGAIPDVDIGQLEAELDDAHKEIARLNYMLSDSPSRKAIDKAKDMRIELLEKAKDELSERVRALKSTMIASSPATTVKLRSSPAAHRQVLTLRTPKTPGAPLKDVSGA